MRHRPFDQIVTEHGPPVLRVCRAVLSHPDADDAWSEYPGLRSAAAERRPGPTDDTEVVR